VDVAGTFPIAVEALQPGKDAVDCVPHKCNGEVVAVPNTCPSSGSTACLNEPSSKGDSPSPPGGTPAILFEAEIARLGLDGFLSQRFVPDESFTALSLADNSIGDGGADVAKQLLAGCDHLRRLNLTRCGISHQGFGHVGVLAENCATLEVLVLSGNQPRQQPSMDFYAGICKAASLRALHLDACDLSAVVLRPLCDVICSATGDAGLDLPLPRLERLNLGRNSLDAEALCEVARLVSDGSSLRELQLSACGLGPKGAEMLACAISKAPASRLRRLLLDRNGLGLRGCSSLLRAWAAETGPRLDLLDLQDNGVAESGCAELCRLVGKAPASSIKFDGGRQVLISWRRPQGRLVRSTWQGREPTNVFWDDTVR